jgi:ribosome biogenesis GTPase / thiamine phosphate phosphatase
MVSQLILIIFDLTSYKIRMKLEDLGYNSEIEVYQKDNNLDSLNIGRVISEHKDRYVVKADSGEFNAELIGNLRFNAESRYDLPAVGDWVAFTEYDEDKALIHTIYPRHSIIERQAVGKKGQKQIIATNIDYGLIVQAVNRDFNVNRLERYLTLCNDSKIEPIILLNKIDLIDALELSALLKLIKERIKKILIIPISNETNVGLDELTSIINKGKTYCLLGSSGVGKSTLLNNLIGERKMNTGFISQSIDRGKHITSHRELFVLEKGGILIDNPGMREVGIADSSGGLEITFESVYEYARNCRFKDCTHTHENGCAVLQAVEEGKIDKDSYSNFRKMEKEKMYFESDAQERKRKEKGFGKMIKSIKKQRKKHKY